MVDRYTAYKTMKEVKQGTLVLALSRTDVSRGFVRVAKGFLELKEWALAWLRQTHQFYQLNR